MSDAKCEYCGQFEIYCARGESAAADAECWEEAWRRRGLELERALAHAESLERELAIVKAGMEEFSRQVGDVIKTAVENATFPLEERIRHMEQIKRPTEIEMILAGIPTEYFEGEWMVPGEHEPAAVVTYAAEPSPETGHVGWQWWAQGRMGEAKDYESAKRAAVEALQRIIDDRMAVL